MATKTKTEVKAVTEADIKQAVQVWAKAEYSAIWALIKVVSRGLLGFNGAERKTRLSALKTWLNGAIEEVYGQGAARDRAAHVSKILKIADNATQEHFSRWAKDGTGFYKAYAEFATPQANPASAKAAAAAGKGKPDTVEVPREGPTSWTAPETDGTGRPIADPDDVKAAAAGKAQMVEVQGYKRGTPGTGVQENVPADSTVIWAGKIDADHRVWSQLMEAMTDKKHFILTPDMVLKLMQALGKKAIHFQNSIAVLLQTEWIRKEVVEFIKNYPQLFEGISVEEPKVKEAAKA